MQAKTLTSNAAKPVDQNYFSRVEEGEQIVNIQVMSVASLRRRAMRFLGVTLALLLLATGSFRSRADLAFGRGQETQPSGRVGIIVKIHPQPRLDTQATAAQPLDQVMNLLGGDPKNNSQIRLVSLIAEADDPDLYHLSIENAQPEEVGQLLARLNSLESVEFAHLQSPAKTLEREFISPATSPSFYLDSVTGTNGFLLKYITPSLSICSAGSPSTLFWAKNSNTIFEPASTIKFLHHVHAMLQVQNGSAQLTELIPVPVLLNGSCPISWGPKSDQQLETVLANMMWASNNAATDAVRARFGQDAINDTAEDLAMSNTLLLHKPGCGGPLPNMLTLTDAGKIYEQAFAGNLFDAPNRAKLSELMPNLLQELNDLIPLEAFFTYKMAVPKEFWNNLKVANKAGGYTLWQDGGWKIYRSIAGYVELPVKAKCLFGATTISKRRYVYGVFINKSASPETAVNDAFSLAITELWRQAVRDALATFK